MVGYPNNFNGYGYGELGLTTMDSLMFGLSVITVFATNFIGMANLNFAMDKAHIQLIKCKPFWLPVTFLKPVYLRVMGWIFLAVVLKLSIQIWGFSIGLAAYFGVLTFGVGVLVFLLSYQLAWVIRLVGLATILCIFYVGIIIYYKSKL